MASYSSIGNGGYHMNGNVAGSTYDHPTAEAWAKISKSFQKPKTTTTKKATATPTATATVAQPTVAEEPVYESYGGGGGFDYAAMIEEMLEKQRQAAEEAYGRAKERLDNAWGDTLTSLDNNKSSALGQLKQNYDYTSGQAQTDADKSLREAYINYMMNKKNMGQNLSAMGVSGGTSESSLANMYNNYGSSRNNINTTLADNLASLLNAYQNNASGVEQAYNSQYADAKNNYMAQLNSLESALAQNLVSQYSGGSLSNLANYASTLSKLVGNMAGTGFTPTENTLGVNSVSTRQGLTNDPGTATNYAKYKALMDEMQNSGASSSQIIQQLKNAGASQNDVLGLYGLL